MKSEFEHRYGNQSENDSTLWKSFKYGDRDSFSAIYQKYSHILLLYGLKITDDKELVMDCIQDLFIELWKNKLNLAVPNSVKAYLFSSMQRRLIKYLGRQNADRIQKEKYPSLEIVYSREDELIESQTFRENKNLIKGAIGSLTMRQKQVIFLKFYADFTYQEISEVMLIGKESLYNLLSKAIEKLRNRLDK